MKNKFDFNKFKNIRIDYTSYISPDCEYDLTKRPLIFIVNFLEIKKIHKVPNRVIELQCVGITFNFIYLDVVTYFFFATYTFTLDLLNVFERTTLMS